jgi:hypothetical protein
MESPTYYPWYLIDSLITVVTLQSTWRTDTEIMFRLSGILRLLCVSLSERSLRTWIRGIYNLISGPDWNSGFFSVGSAYRGNK